MCYVACCISRCACCVNCDLCCMCVVCAMRVVYRGVRVVLYVLCRMLYVQVWGLGFQLELEKKW